MDEDITLGIFVPGLPRGRSVTERESEVLLRSVVTERKREYEGTIWDLMGFYSNLGQAKEAQGLTDMLVQMADSPEKEASLWLALGQMAEKHNDFEQAISKYQHGLGTESRASQTRYLLNNNLGYSLIQVGRYEEAEQYCRTAIDINPRRYNAHKNLGLSLDGQGKTLDAAQSFMASVRANAGDRRAYDHLADLVGRHPTLKDQDPDIEEFLKRGHSAVRMAADIAGAVSEGQKSKSPPLTAPEKIMIAVTRLFQEGDITTFTWDDVRRSLGVSRDVWMSSFTAIFQAMRKDEPGGAPDFKTKYRGVFQKVSGDDYELTYHGRMMVAQIHKL